MAFTPSSSTTATTVRAALGSNLGAGTIDFGIVTGVSAPPAGLPSALGSFTVPANTTAVYTASFSFALTAGTQYWLVLWSEVPVNGRWVLSTPTVIAPVALQTGSPAATWSAFSSAQAVFSLSDASGGGGVPEPASASLIATGTLAVIAVRRRIRS